MWEKFVELRKRFCGLVSSRVFWTICITSCLIGVGVGYQLVAQFVISYKEAKWEESECRNSKLSSKCGEAERMVHELEAQLDQVKPDFWVGSNEFLCAELEKLKGMCENQRSRIGMLENECNTLKALGLEVPVDCTNGTLLNVAYDIEAKKTLRSGAITNAMDRLATIRVQMATVAINALKIQDAKIRNKTLQDPSQEKLLLQYVEMLIAVDNLHAHFIRHVIDNIDCQFFCGLKESTDKVRLRLKASFKTIDNAQAILNRIMLLDSGKDGILAEMTEIINHHFVHCK